MPYPKEYWDAEEQARGKLWREFINVLGLHSEIRFEAIEAVLEHYREKGRVDPSSGSALISREDWAEMKDEMAGLRLGLEMWQRHEKELGEAAALHDKEPVQIGRRRAREAWYSRTWTEYDYESPEWIKVLVAIYKEVYPHKAVPRKGSGRTSALIRMNDHLRGDLHHVLEIEALQRVALRTWHAREEDRQPWDWDDFVFVNDCYEEQCFSLDLVDRDTAGFGEAVDPGSIVTGRWTRGSGMGASSLTLTLGAVVHVAVIDFAEELISYNMHKAAKGSFQCEECGQFVPRSFYGRGQLYCSAQCKRRAAKRRQREKQKKRREREAWGDRALA